MSFFLGAGLAVAGTAATSTGFILQKMSHGETYSTTSDGATAGRRLFFGGFGLQLLGVSASFVVLALLAQSEAYAFAALTVVWNVLLSWKVLKERVGVWDVVATGMILLGTAAATVANASNTTRAAPRDTGEPSEDGGGGGDGGGDGGVDRKMTPDEVRDRLRSSTSTAGFAVFGALAAAGAAAVEYTATGSHGGGDGAALWRDLSPAVLAGLFGGFTGLFGKSMASHVSHGDWSGSLFLFAALAAFTVLGQLRYVNVGFRHADAHVIMPTYQAVLILCAVTFGWLFYGETEDRSAWSVAASAVGLVVTAAGVALLVTKGLAAGPSSPVSRDGAAGPKGVFIGPTPAVPTNA